MWSAAATPSTGAGWSSASLRAVATCSVRSGRPTSRTSSWPSTSRTRPDSGPSWCAWSPGSHRRRVRRLTRIPTALAGSARSERRDLPPHRLALLEEPRRGPEDERVGLADQLGVLLVVVVEAEDVAHRREPGLPL